MQPPPNQEQPQQQGQPHTSWGSSPLWQHNEPLHPQYPPQMPPPPPQWQQPPPLEWNQQPPPNSYPHFPQQQGQRPPMPVQPSQWGQQLPPPSGQPFSSQPPYGVSPSPDIGQSQQLKKRSRRWLWIRLAAIGGMIYLICLFSTLTFATNLARSDDWDTLFGLLLVLFFCIVISLLRSIVSDYILDHGDLVEGRITEHHQKGNEDGFPFYYQTYTYEYMGKTYSKKQRVSEETYREIPDGIWIGVRCLPKHPQRARIEERWSRDIVWDLYL